jgi:hypothetical protein
VQGYLKTGINFAGVSTLVANGGTAPTFTADATGKTSAITLTTNQAICFLPSTGAGTGVYIYWNGTNLVAYKNGSTTNII